MQDKIVFRFCLFVWAIVFAMPSHAQQYGGGNYTGATEARRMQQVQLAEVIDIRRVSVQTSDWSTQAIGGVIGGALGAVIGSRVGQDGSAIRYTVAAVAGSAGAMLGSKVANIASDKEGVEYLVKLQDGRVFAVTQQVDESINSIRVGSQVRLQDLNGQTRVVPLRSV